MRKGTKEGKEARAGKGFMSQGTQKGKEGMAGKGVHEPRPQER